MAAIDKMDGLSANPQEELLALLRKHAPHVFSENDIDLTRLAAAVGKDVSKDKERYGLSWAGKNDCFRHIQEPTTATLKPCRDESVDFDTTENLFIEGDNLQVLKVLQKSFYGKVKMIYIDPPYNTGSDTFIYPDRFQETQDEYLQRIGDKDAEGNMTTDGFWRKNTRDAGHFHSNWLSMMYPRLFLAKNLLRPDGVIFVSIDDNEVHNLTMIMNEVFGEENFLATLVWKKRSSPDARATIGSVHDYILCYLRNGEQPKSSVSKMALSDSRRASFSNPDNDPRGPWASVDMTGMIGRATKEQFFKVTLPSGRIIGPPEGRSWGLAEATFKKLRKDNRIWFGASGDNVPRIKNFLHESDGQVVPSFWDMNEAGSNDEASKETSELLGAPKIFDTPKPTRLILRMLQISTASENNDIILDFFAGACTTADAVMRLNAEDGGNRKYICVQLPELCDKDSEAYKAGFQTIADIGMERIRRAAAKIKKENEGKLDFDNASLDLGFKVFKLDQSNFKIWRSDVQDAETLKKQLSLFVDNVNSEAQQENILYELILKSGLDLNAKIEVKKVNGKQYFIVEGSLIICLEEEITEKLVEKILAERPNKVLCLDRAFAGNDQLKTNTALQMEAEKIEFKVI